MKKYNIIYADPPWDYVSKKTGRDMNHGAKDKYNVMTLQDIKEMPINELTQENAVCFMWVTVPLLDVGIETLKAWGFGYKTFITWEKEGGLGMGHWLRVQTEHIIIGVKGNVKPFKCQRKNIVKYPMCGHSKKPHIFRELVLELTKNTFSDPERLEMFARSRAGMFPDYEYEGWDVYGNQVNNSISI